MYTGADKKRDRAQVDPEEKAEDGKGVYEIFNRSKKTIRSPEQREAEIERKKAENKAKYRGRYGI